MMRRIVRSFSTAALALCLSAFAFSAVAGAAPKDKKGTDQHEQAQTAAKKHKTEKHKAENSQAKHKKEKGHDEHASTNTRRN